MQKKSFLCYRRILSTLMLCVLVFGLTLNAGAARSFKGKVITFVLPYSAGGGTDMMGRLVANHMSRYIPGQPTIVVRNMVGAGGLIGANYVYAARPNGLTALVASAGSVTMNLVRPKGTVFKLEEMHPVYANPVGVVYFSRPNLVKKPRDVMTAKGLIFGHVSPTAGVSGGFIWSKEVLGFNTEKIIWGYGGASAANMAFFSGETNFNGQATTGYNASIKQYVDRGEVELLYQSGLLDEDGNVVREPSAPDVPTLVELYEELHGKKPSGKAFDAFKVFVGSRTYGKCVLFPKDTPAEIVDVMRKAAEEMVKDPKFLKEAKKLNPNSPNYAGNSLARVYAAGISAPKEILDYMKDYLTKEYKVVFD